MKIKTIILGLTLLIICLNACKPGSGTHAVLALNDTIPSEDTLSVEVAKRYVSNYARNAAMDSVTDKISKKKIPNTRCIWFSLKRLKLLVNKLDSEGGDGVRFYLGAYDTTYKKHYPNKPDSIYWGHNTLLMISTYKVSPNNIHQDYYTNGPITNGKFKNGHILVLSPENRGELCPPPNPCTGATLLSGN